MNNNHKEVRGQWGKTLVLVDTPEGTKTMVVIAFIPMDQDEDLLGLGNCEGSFKSDLSDSWKFKTLTGFK